MCEHKNLEYCSVCFAVYCLTCGERWYPAWKVYKMLQVNPNCKHPPRNGGQPSEIEEYGKEG